ncbi:Translin-associated factor X-interacting protein [Phytophthora infestans]|uniref:Translin-associated factor X-interacting protein n=1 Tax=Phytophthora infestans TaxID=4787 RepID=A0A833S872_PHYIN|nr:Translin-associated factor X-interacting protein [Phytophthora infestans]
MDFVSVGLASPPPRRPTEAKGSATTTSSLPPLQTTSDISPSPRKHDKSRPIQVSSWPLTFAPESPRRIPTDSIDHDAFSPISPKVQKLHTRTRLLDDSRTRPALLQELLDFLHTELDGERESRNPSLRRLQIVREALNRLIDGFSVYAPVLLQIRDEYERAVEDLHARNLMIPGLQTRLQSLETHCLQQLSAYSAEAKSRSLVLKKRLAETQALLAASTAENARLTAALRSEKDYVTRTESKLTDVQRSTLTLSE